MKNRIAFTILLTIVMTFAACINRESVTTVYNADRVSTEKLAKEGTVVFVRPSEYSVFGTESIRDYIEIAYERASRNGAGLLQLDLGLRNRGGQRFYDTGGPAFQVSVKTSFYDKPLASGAPQAVPAYETNWQAIRLLRGATEHYQVTCPVSSAGYYQVTISELLK